eukprot:8467143-Pyramimonas_sp.AAC.1
MRAVILLQEVHGSEYDLSFLLRQFPYEYRTFFSAASSPGKGGVAILIPWYKEADLVKPPSDVIPSFLPRCVVPGRILSLQVRGA